MKVRTHERIDPALCGRPVSLEPGRARVVLDTIPSMTADDRALVHGGFTFGLADYAAMLAVNEPTVVLASAEVKFLGPVVAGERLEAQAEVERSEDRKRWVTVEVRREGQPVLTARLVAVVLERHVLDASR
jgi:acyl-coenzyme A thioesterase PaaI-like protein